MQIDQEYHSEDSDCDSAATTEISSTDSLDIAHNGNGLDDPDVVRNRKIHDQNLNISPPTEQKKKESGKRNGCHYTALPPWLQDNNFIHYGHRAPLPSVVGCIKSIFHIHTETGNIWSHLLGCVVFLLLALSFILGPNQIEDKIVFSFFFAGVITCLFLSSAYHTLRCHSPSVGKLFHKLDYVGIASLIMASFVPWLHYSFRCEPTVKNTYMAITFLLGMSTIIFSLFDKFAQPVFRPVRAGLFIVFGLSGIVPAFHYLIVHGWEHSITRASVGWLALHGFLYILGALFYANRVPERWRPGKCDIWFQSHQIFHVLVVAAALVHYYGISQMLVYRHLQGECVATITTESGKLR